MNVRTVGRTGEAKMIRALLAALLCAGWLFHGGDLAHAQAYPGKEPIKIIVPFPPGGPTDGMARIISERLGRVLGRSSGLENRARAGGGVGCAALRGARRRPGRASPPPPRPEPLPPLAAPGRSAPPRPRRNPRHRLRSGQGL